MGETIPGQDPEAKQPGVQPFTKEFFESDSRSWQLRDLCLELANTLSQYLAGAVQLEPVILDLAQRLEALNVTPGMNLGRTQEEYAKDPVLFAEYIAGQCLNLLPEIMDRALDSDAASLEKPRRLKEEDTFLIEGHSLINTTRRMFGADLEEE